MVRAGQWETKLGELGAFLDAQEARQIEIVEEPRCLAVRWQQGREGPRLCSFIGADAPAGSVPAPSLSGIVHPPESAEWWSWATLLRALGHEIDEEEIDVACIKEEPGGLLLTGARWGKQVSRLYPYAQLRGGFVRPGIRVGGPAWQTRVRAGQMLRLLNKKPSPRS
jgi:hypothetical protein